ncbi:CrcB protein [Elusimicrobium posterum]|uniref:fluoride efflux transporter CrcB n=1 Tax=Elusimicrobium posterum TaxID=3116653 RepID=UPI003C77E2CC
MNALYKILVVGAGGFFGAGCRYMFYILLASHSAKHGWPYATLTVNVLGSALIGFLAAPLASKGEFWQLFVLAGFLGGFTTFSSFSYETLSLLHAGQLVKVFFNVILNVGLCLGSVLAGFELYKVIFKGAVL